MRLWGRGKRFADTPAYVTIETLNRRKMMSTHASVVLAANHVNVSAPLRVPALDFLAALNGNSPSAAALSAAKTFVDEADPADMIASGETSFRQLADFARFLPQTHPNRQYLNAYCT